MAYYYKADYRGRSSEPAVYFIAYRDLPNRYRGGFFFFFSEILTNYKNNLSYDMIIVHRIEVTNLGPTVIRIRRI
jgi:hypothetical protein